MEKHFITQMPGGPSLDRVGTCVYAQQTVV